jgi:iron complex outermembrane recepter protein
MSRLAVASTFLLVAAPVAAQVPAQQPDSARRLPGVVVTATRDSISPLSSPLPTAVVTAAELRRDHGVSLAQTLVRLPGVRALATGEQVGKPVIRGMGGARVLVLDDGLRLEATRMRPPSTRGWPSASRSFAGRRACSTDRTRSAAW